MNALRHVFLLITFVMISQLTEAQQRIWIEGEVRSADSLLPIKNAHIISRLNRSGSISNEKGDFIIRGRTSDTIMFSAVGFQRSVMSFDSTMLQTGKPWIVLLRKDTILMEEVVIRSFYDWPTFKHLFVTMKPIKAVNLEDINDELRDILLYLDPAPYTLKGPIQTLYDLFNDAARLQRRMQRNRKAYNDQLIKEGRFNELIPEELDHEQK